MTRIIIMRGDLEGQRSRRVFAHNSTTKNRGITKIGRRFVRAGGGVTLGDFIFRLDLSFKLKFLTSA